MAGTLADSVIVGVQASTSSLIRGLLSGVRWDTSVDLIITYSAPGSPAEYNYGGETANFSGITVAQGNAFLWAIRLIEDYTRLDFQQTAAPGADIRFANTTGQSHGYYPTGHDSMGDVWMGDMNNPFTAQPITNPIQGDFNFATHIHELGHAIGLKHGHETGGPTQQVNGNPIPQYAPLPAQFDNWNWSIMTYRSYAGANPSPVQGNMNSDNPITFMPADILALQYMYGAEYTGISSGNTTYRWNSAGFFSMNGVLPVELNNQPAANGKMLMTVWDGGGNDTYDFSLFDGTNGPIVNQVINLNPGAFSTFNPGQVVDLDREAAVRPALGNVANAFLFNNNPASLIENAIAGSGNDTLTGNQAVNNLQGGIGNDWFNATPGNDTLNGGPGNDTFNLAADPVGDILVDASGSDKVRTTITRGIQPWTFIETLILDGSANINGTGNSVANTIFGNSGANILVGQGGSDSMLGGGGNDWLYGQAGLDRLKGEAGNDRFALQSVNDSLPGAANRDWVYDFDKNGDDIFDFTAVPGLTSFIGLMGFTAPGQVRVRQAGTSIVIELNTVGNSVPEAEVLVLNTTIGNGVNQLNSGDFLI